ncbi:MAG: hypothetical protein WC307_05470 [Candidatus Nanoarchaeia archaeon]|jgi:hypothetical protein
MDLNPSLNGDISFYAIEPFGRCICYYNPVKESNDLCLDKDLVCGAVMAINTMASYIGFDNNGGFELAFLKGNLDRAIELRLTKGLHNFGINEEPRSIYGLLTFNNVSQLDDYVYKQFDGLNNYLVKQLENSYEDELSSFINGGINFDSNVVSFSDSFKSIVRDSFIRLKEESYTFYLIDILSLSTNCVKKDQSIELLKEVTCLHQQYADDIAGIRKYNDLYRAEIVKMSLEPQSKTFIDCIKKANNDKCSIWSLMKVPIIELCKTEE